jgi:hypothetical protein
MFAQSPCNDYVHDNNKMRLADMGGADIEILSHSISDIQSEVLWRFY